MNELFYNIKLTFWFIIVMTFIAFWNIKLERLTNMQTIWFLSLPWDFTISTSSFDYDNYDSSILYLFKNEDRKNEDSTCLSSEIPPECLTTNSRKSIKCLKILKKKWYWYVNWLYFEPSDNNCLSRKNQ